MDLPQSPLRDIAAYTYAYMYIFYIISILNCQKEDIGRKTQSALCILHFFFRGFSHSFTTSFGDGLHHTKGGNQSIKYQYV